MPPWCQNNKILYLSVSVFLSLVLFFNLILPEKFFSAFSFLFQLLFDLVWLLVFRYRILPGGGLRQWRVIHFLFSIPVFLPRFFRFFSIILIVISSTWFAFFIDVLPFVVLVPGSVCVSVCLSVCLCLFFYSVCILWSLCSSLMIKLEGIGAG